MLSFFFCFTWAGISVFKAFCIFGVGGPGGLYQGWFGSVHIHGGVGGKAGMEKGWLYIYIYIKELHTPITYPTYYTTY